MSWAGIRRGDLRAPVEDIPWLTILLVGAGVALVVTVVQWAVAAGVGLSIRPIGFVVVAAAVVAGRPARWGSAAGLLFTGVLLAGWSVAVAWAVAAFVAVSVSIRLWARTGRDRDESWARWTLRYIVVAVGGVLVFAATNACLLDVFGRAAFSVAVGRTVVTDLPLAVAGAPLVRLALGHVGAESGRSAAGPTTTRTRIAVVSVATLWTVSGYVGSFLFRAVEQVPPENIERRFPSAVQDFIYLWGHQGTYAQLVLGVVSLAAVALLLRWGTSRARRDRPGTRS